MTLEELAAKFRGPAKRAGHRLMVFCSSHEDESRQSLALSRGDDGKLLAHCYAGCGTEAILAAVGLRITDLFPDRPTNGNGHAPHTTAGREIVAAYDYADGAGVVRYQVVRFAPKDFRQRRPDGQGGWIWNLQGVQRVLYRLPDLAEQARVFLCEGEKDAEALATLGVAATTVAGGAEAWRDDYARQLVALGARELVILPDQDKAGEKYAVTAARACLVVGLDVRILRLPGLGPKGDVFDWLAAGGTRESLEALVACTATVTIAELTAEDAPAAAAEEAATKFLRGPAIFSVKLAETDWLIRNVFSVAHQHMVTGASQSSKSWTVFDVGIAVAHPEITTVLGQSVCRHGRVVIESWEMGQAEDVRRLQKGIRGHGLATASDNTRPPRCRRRCHLGPGQTVS